MTARTVVRKKVRPSYWASPVGWRVLQAVIAFLVRLVYRYQVTGQENLPKQGPAILAVNHLHLFDPAIVATLLPYQVVTLAAAKWKKHWLIRSILKMAGVIFVKRGAVDRQALRESIEVLENRGVLAIAPEGTRSRAHQLQRGKPGIAYLALRTNAIIVPIAFWGVEKLAEWRRLRRPRCHVVVGRPFRLPQLPGRPSTGQLQELADLVMIQIGRLLPPSYRGYYANRIAAIEAGQRPALDVTPV